MLCILLSLSKVFKYSSCPVLLGDPDFRVDADVTNKLQAANSNGDSNGGKQRINLRPQPTIDRRHFCSRRRPPPIDSPEAFEEREIEVGRSGDERRGGEFEERKRADCQIPIPEVVDIHRISERHVGSSCGGLRPICKWAVAQ